MIVLILIILFISWLLFKLAAGSMSFSQLNIVSVIFYYNIMLNAFPGSILIYYTDVSNSVLSKVDDDYRKIGLYLILYMMVAFPLGVLIAKRLFFRLGNISFLERFQREKLRGLASEQDQLARLMITILAGICFLALCYVTVSIGTVPQLSFLSNMSHADILRIRVENSREFSGLLFVKTIFFEQLTPLLSLIAYVYCRLTKKKYDKWLFIILFIMSIYTVTFALSKSTLVVYLSYYIFLRIYLIGRIPIFRFVLLSGMLLLLLTFMFFVVTEQASSDVFAYMLNRIFIDQVSGLYLMLQLFPHTYPFIGFDSMSGAISGLLGNDLIQPSTRIAMEYAFPAAVAEGRMNLLSTLFIGEAWANFGWIGVVLSPLYVGFVTGFIYYFTLARRKTPLLIALLAYCSFGTNFSSQLNLYIYNSVMVSLIIILLCVFVFSVGGSQLSGRNNHSQKN